jgi:DNA-binding NarL/FixJ family response regulator
VRLAVLCPDLLLGSKLEGGLGAAGHEVDRVSNLAGARAAAHEADVLVVDLGTDEVDGVAAVETLRAGGELGATRTLGFYPHVDVDTRRRAEAAGFDLVVPRSRMMREMAELVQRAAA